jgi:mono/diheme cytochrome c family protein
MARFFAGFITATVVILLTSFCVVRFGFVDPRADAEPWALESKIAMPALDAAVERRAPAARNPIPPTGENLIAGMKIYQGECAGCHGDLLHPHSAFGDSFFPRAPQFVEDAPDMPDNQNFYIIEHGVRLTGMPAWRISLKESEMWEVTTFLSHMRELPPEVRSAWKSAAAGAPAS